MHSNITLFRKSFIYLETFHEDGARNSSNCRYKPICTVDEGNSEVRIYSATHIYDVHNASIKINISYNITRRRPTKA
jgi:hypothetical protein